MFKGNIIAEGRVCLFWEWSRKYKDYAAALLDSLCVHYPGWILTVQGHLWMLHMNSSAISTPKADICMVLHSCKWDIVSAGHWLEHICTNMVSHCILFSVSTPLHVFHSTSSAFSACCLRAFCELCYAICIAITLHYQEKTVLGYV